MHEDPQLGAYSIMEFCKAHNLSRSMFYVLVRRGKAPRVMRIGKRRLVSVEAACEWRRSMEFATRGNMGARGLPHGGG